MNKNLRRSVVALTAALASLAFLATPASATTHNATVNAGTYAAVNGTSTLTGPLGGTTGLHCGTAITYDVDRTVTPPTVDVTGYTRTEHFVFAGQHWVSVTTRVSSTPGSISTFVIGGTTTPTFTSSVEIYAQPSNGSTGTDCTPHAPLPTCTWRFLNVTLSGTYTSSPTPVLGSLESGSTYNVSGTGVIATQLGAPCGGPFSPFIGGTVTLTNMAGLVTS